MKDPLKINVEYLAKTYGLEPPVAARIEDGNLVVVELEPQVAVDLDTIRAIGETYE